MLEQYYSTDEAMVRYYGYLVIKKIFSLFQFYKKRIFWLYLFHKYWILIHLSAMQFFDKQTDKYFRRISMYFIMFSLLFFLFYLFLENRYTLFFFFVSLRPSYVEHYHLAMRIIQNTWDKKRKKEKWNMILCSRCIARSVIVFNFKQVFSLLTLLQNVFFFLKHVFFVTLHIYEYQYCLFGCNFGFWTFSLDRSTMKASTYTVFGRF